MILANAKIGEFHMTKSRGTAIVAMIFERTSSKTIDLVVDGTLRIYNEYGYLNTSALPNREEFDILYFIPKEKYPEYYL